MSKLRQANGDDHPDAAEKHLGCAVALESAGLADGGCYLAGYVVECCLKSLILLEKGHPPPGKLHWQKGAAGHDLHKLAAEVATLSVLAGQNTSKYFGYAARNIASAAVAAWDPAMRYRSTTHTNTACETWVLEAMLLYDETVFSMKLDGVA